MRLLMDLRRKLIRLFGLIIFVWVISPFYGCSIMSNSISVKLANRDFNKGNYSEAIHHYNNVINKLPASSNEDEPGGVAYLLYLRGYSYMKIDKCGNALPDLYQAYVLMQSGKEATSFSADFQRELNSDICLAIGICNINSNDYEAARNYLNLSLQYNPNDYLTLRYLGIAEYESHHYEEAKESFQKSLEINSSEENKQAIRKYYDFNH